MKACTYPECAGTSPYYAKNMCKNCYMRDMRKQRPEMFKAYETKKREKHGDKMRAYDRERAKTEPRKAACRERRKAKPEVYRAYEAKRRTDERRQYARDLREKKLDHFRAYDRARYHKNPEPRKELVNRRRGHQGKATPKWLTDEQKQQLRDIYTFRPPGYHVDHIIPLKGKNVCGLHVPENLQYLLATDNLKKGNRT